ncbi:MAG: hypothetical protein DI613_14540 [Kocuria rhizophila]|nr:MAG: hypothetical protein DI613_14540 [Kocuria rhizophila]
MDEKTSVTGDFVTTGAPGIVFSRGCRVLDVQACQWTEADQKWWERRWRPIHWVSLVAGLLVLLILGGNGPVVGQDLPTSTAVAHLVVLAALWAWLYVPNRHWVALTAWIVIGPGLGYAVTTLAPSLEVAPDAPFVRGFLLGTLTFGAFAVLTTVAGVARRRIKRQRELFAGMTRWSGLAKDARSRGLQIVRVEEAIPERGGKETRILARRVDGTTRSMGVWGWIASGQWLGLEESRNAAWRIPATDSVAWATLDARGARRQKALRGPQVGSPDQS